MLLSLSLMDYSCFNLCVIYMRYYLEIVLQDSVSLYAMFCTGICCAGSVSVAEEEP